MNLYYIIIWFWRLPFSTSYFLSFAKFILRAFLKTMLFCYSFLVLTFIPIMRFRFMKTLQSIALADLYPFFYYTFNSIFKASLNSFRGKYENNIHTQIN
jgi:hypothetical protein